MLIECFVRHTTATRSLEPVVALNNLSAAAD